MSATISSYIPTTGGTDTRTRDQLSFTYSARPQDMTVYTRFIELGTSLVGSRVWQIGDTSNTSPRLILFQTGTGYQVFYQGDSASVVTSTTASLPSIGDLVEISVELTNDGTVTIRMSLNGGAEAAVGPSSGLALAQAWSGTSISINSVGTTGVGYNAFMNVVAVRGIHSLARMRRFAGVTQ